MGANRHVAASVPVMKSSAHFQGKDQTGYVRGDHRNMVAVSVAPDVATYRLV